MKIGFDAKRIFQNFTGLGNYSRNLVSGLATYFPEQDYHLYAPKIQNTPDTAPFLNASRYTLHSPFFRPLGSYWRSKSVVKDIVRDGMDIFHGLSHEMPIDLEKTHVKSVVSMHDVIFKKFPEQFSWLDRKIYDYKWRHACENADAIIAISESTKKDLVALYGAEERKIHVVYQPCANNFREDIPAHLLYQVREKYQLPQEYLLYVGSLISRKQVPLLIEALAHLGRDERLTLVLVGNGPEKEAIEHIAKKMSVMHKLRWMHGVSNEELPAFYKMATAFVYPSIYEGFGIPVVEAMSCGTPVITANISSMPEAGGPHTAYFEAGNADSLTTVLSQVLRSTERQKKMSQEGLAYSQRFHPQIISQALMNVYKSVLR